MMMIERESRIAHDDDDDDHHHRRLSELFSFDVATASSLYTPSLIRIFSSSFSQFLASVFPSLSPSLSLGSFVFFFFRLLGNHEIERTGEREWVFYILSPESQRTLASDIHRRSQRQKEIREDSLRIHIFCKKKIQIERWYENERENGRKRVKERENRKYDWCSWYGKRMFPLSPFLPQLFLFNKVVYTSLPTSAK